MGHNIKDYCVWPMNDLREFAEVKGITIDYHPHLTKLTRLSKIVEVSRSDRREILFHLDNWTDEEADNVQPSI